MKTRTNSTEQKVILVTGGSSGIGRSAVILLAEQGHVVYAAARRVERMDDLKALGIRPLKLDITKPEDCRSAVKQIEKEAGKIDVLINNAGYGAHGCVEEVPLDEVRRQFEVNVVGLVGMTQEVLPGMRKRKSGKIVNVSSLVGKVSPPVTGIYSASKHAVEAISDALRLEVRDLGIQVVLVEPGGIQTEFMGIAMDGAEDASRIEDYRKWNEGYQKLMVADSQSAPGPDVIGRLLMKVVKKSKPKARYSAPFESSVFIFLRRILPDSWIDAIVRREFRRRSKVAV